MKTQINKLVNGSKNVIGRSKDFKGGSNYNIRSEISNKVKSENKDIMIVTVNEIKLTLDRSESISGKTTNFSSNITRDQYQEILGFDSDIKNYQAEYSFTINNDLTCQIDVFARKNENSQWKHRGYTYVAESLVKIN